MIQNSKRSLRRVVPVVSLAVVLALFYLIWTHSTNTGNLILIFISALFVAALFSSAQSFPAVTPKKIIYSILYVFYLFISIIKSNFDVARRVVQPVIPLNPGIVRVRTRLKSAIGRMILANSITLTPGTLTVDIQGDHLFIHWIDITNMDEQGASKVIVEGFEKYLEVIFG